MPVESIFLTISTKTLSQVFKEINKLVLLNGDDSLQHVIEIELKNGYAEIKSIGIVLSTDCDTNFNGKVFVPCPVFQMIAEFSEQDLINLEIKNGEISFNNLKYKAEKILLIDFNEEDEFELSMNYSPLELLSIRRKYTEESIERRNFTKKLEEEEELFETAKEDAYKILKRYEVKRDDIHAIIEKRIKKYL